MSASDVNYYAKSSSYVLEHALKMVENHLKWLKTGWGVRLKRRIAAATPLQREMLYSLEEKEYKDAVAQTEDRSNVIKKALDIARKREGKRR